MPLQKIELDEKPRGIPKTIDNHNDYKATKIPTCSKRPDEPELKLLIPSTYKVLDIFRSLYSLHKGQNSNIQLADSRIIARDPLVSFAEDTQNFEIMRKTGEQLRRRGPLDLKNHDHADPLEVLWRGQSTVKTLFSEAAGIGADRTEVEAKIPSRDIRYAYDHFIEHDRPCLDQIYYDINSSDLYVAAICITTRASFNSIVYVAEYDAYVEFENTCDPNYFLTPNGDVRTGRDMEYEAEAKMLYVRPELGLTDTQLKDIYQQAKAQYQEFILGRYPDFEISKYSKVERALRAVGEFYHENHDGSVTSDFSDASQFVAELPYERHISQGMAFAIRQKITIWDAVQNINTIAKIARGMAQPNQLLPANDDFETSKCAADDRNLKGLRLAS